MQSANGQSGDLSQDTEASLAHPTPVTAAPVKLERSVDRLDPATASGRSFFQSLSASSVGLELGISVALGLGFGIWLDGKLGTEPWMMLLWLVIGLASGFRGVLRAVKRSDRWAAAEVGELSKERARG